MSTGVPPLRRIDPIPLSVLEDPSDTAWTGTLMNLDLSVTLGLYCQLLQRLPLVLRVAWELTVQTCTRTSPGGDTLLK